MPETPVTDDHAPPDPQAAHEQQMALIRQVQAQKARADDRFGRRMAAIREKRDRDADEE